MFNPPLDRCRSFALALLAGTLAVSPPIFAQPETAPPEEIVALSPAEAGEDFQYQGEFSGKVGEDSAEWGLQVVARGNGDFLGALLLGGLPGDGWDGETRVELEGLRGADFLVLAADGWKVDVRPGEATVIRDGETLGRLERRNRTSPTLGMSPPPVARVLFDGSNTDAFTKGEISEDGLLMPGADLEPTFSHYRLHVEFRTPFMPSARGQSRGNSGVYLQSRYETQVLDSFGLVPQFNDCGSLYRTIPPAVNMAFPPLSWQTYDINFEAPLFDDEGNKTRDAFITVWHNGVKIHDAVAIPNKTGAGRPEGPEPLPIRFQNHGDPVRFRNIWIVDYNAAPAPVPPPKGMIEPVPLEVLGRMGGGPVYGTVYSPGYSGVIGPVVAPYTVTPAWMSAAPYDAFQWGRTGTCFLGATKYYAGPGGVAEPCRLFGGRRLFHRGPHGCKLFHKHEPACPPSACPTGSCQTGTCPPPAVTTPSCPKCED